MKITSPSACTAAVRAACCARTVDVLLISVSSLSIVAFLLACGHHAPGWKLMAHIPGILTVHLLRPTPVVISPAGSER